MPSQVFVRLPEAFKAEAAAYADTLGVSLNALCVVALRDYLDARKGLEAAPAPVSVPEPSPAPSPAPSPSPALVRPVRAAAAARVVEPRTGQKVGRNEPCPCGSGRKFKNCCGGPKGV